MAGGAALDQVLGLVKEHGRLDAYRAARLCRSFTAMEAGRALSDLCRQGAVVKVEDGGANELASVFSLSC